MQARHSRKTHARGGPAGLLGGDDAARSPRYERGSTNPVRYMRRNGSAVPGDGGLREKLSGHSENCEPCLFEDLVERGPRERWKRASPADASDSEGQKRATEQGVEEDVLHQCILNPENHGRIASSSIMSAGRADTTRSNSTEETTRSRCPWVVSGSRQGLGGEGRASRLSPRKRHPVIARRSRTLGRSEASSAPRGRTRFQSPEHHPHFAPVQCLSRIFGRYPSEAGQRHAMP
ncbi:hypothetical protein Q5P01_000567 [Channa striata]|uniref:Uncharacterized protein n=1 Tax=Channa striata TaxID=64152 RepID=A0AA88IK04_CHASR|nr:hypothetical protein Q5P01_000567 [Channa striata]